MRWGGKDIQLSCHIHRKNGIVISMWLFISAKLCGLNVEFGVHARKIEVVAGTCKRMRGRQIENDEK